MSDKIYFNTSAKFSVKRSLLNLSTRFHHTVAPKHAKKVARRLLLTPMRTPPKNSEPKGLVKGEVKMEHGVLKTYQLGQGPIWVLSHGWSGTASQFYPLMEHIASKGYTALAYDHPAHGKSDGIYGHIPAFVQGLEAILDSFEEDVAGVIAHSMGTASALECHHRKIIDCPMLLIAPVLDYLDNLFGSVARSGYSLRLFEAIVSEIEEQYHYPIQSVDPYGKLSKRSASTIIVHDRKDKFADFSVSERAANNISTVTLHATTGQGHGRVMTCPQVFESFDQLLVK
ncbi:alpha/beta fold hydrolase [Vibrio genomosp. F10]|uniref:alpha/beta fold hydrolase n=1 Tax=Vibrio genomosp. F10 TaxID=723171 RepID=UPI000304A00D|nr:alpha/beta hydrolase [Vibrio genomosp. F10]OEF11599.1 esterase [Vibrio genomosp. F10 str. 9ZD137]